MTIIEDIYSGGQDWPVRGPRQGVGTPNRWRTFSPPQSRPRVGANVNESGRISGDLRLARQFQGSEPIGSHGSAGVPIIGEAHIGHKPNSP